MGTKLWYLSNEVFIFSLAIKQRWYLSVFQKWFPIPGLLILKTAESKKRSFTICYFTIALLGPSLDFLANFRHVENFRFASPMWLCQRRVLHAWSRASTLISRWSFWLTMGEIVQWSYFSWIFIPCREKCPRWNP